MKRFLFIVTPKTQNGSLRQSLGLPLSDQLTKLQINKKSAKSHIKQVGSRLDWQNLSRLISRTFHNAENEEKTLHLSGSSQSLLFLCEQLKKSELLCQFSHGGKNLLSLHPVLKDQDGAEMQISRLIQLMDSLPGCRLATIIHAEYALDTSNRWDRTEIYYRLLVHGEGELYTDQHMANLDQQPERDNLLVRLPAVHHSFAGIQQGDSLIFISDKTGEYEQMYRAFHRERFAPFERSKIELKHLNQFVPAPDTAQVLLSRLTSYMGERGIPYLKYGNMDDYFFLTEAASHEPAIPDSNEDSVFLPAPFHSLSGIPDYFDTLSRHIDADRYHGIFTALPEPFADSDKNEIYDSVNHSLIELADLAKERSYTSLFCIREEQQSITLYQKEAESNQRIPGITIDELFTNILHRLN